MSGAERVAHAVEMAEEAKAVAAVARRRRRQSLGSMQFEFLSTVVGLLDRAGIPHMLVGSMASTFHGEPRMTRDIDMVIDPTPESMERFVATLDRSRYYVDDAAEAVRRRDMCNVIDTETGWKVDLIVRKDRPFSREEFRRRQPAVIGGVLASMVGGSADSCVSEVQLEEVANTPFPEANS
jgi:hypothetical protein